MEFGSGLGAPPPFDGVSSDRPFRMVALFPGLSTPVWPLWKMLLVASRVSRTIVALTLAIECVVGSFPAFLARFPRSASPRLLSRVIREAIGIAARHSPAISRTKERVCCRHVASHVARVHWL